MEESCTNAVFLYFDCPEIKLAFLQHTVILAYSCTYTYLTLMVGLQRDWCSQKSRVDEKGLLLKCKPVFLYSWTLYPRPAEGVGGHRQLNRYTANLPARQNFCSFHKVLQVLHTLVWQPHFFLLLWQFNDVESTVVALALKSCIYTFFMHFLKCFHEDETN